MKQSVNQYSMLLKSSSSHAIAATFLAVFMTGCGGDSASDSGQVVNYVELPTTFTSFYCPDEGVGEENCVLYNPVNPYARAAVNATNPETNVVYKWELNDEPQSILSKFYLWATVHAVEPQGENQFYAAENLHRLFSQEGNVSVQEQAKKGYRSLLDNFFGSVTFTGPANNQVENLLRNWVGDRLVNPSRSGLPQLFDSQSLAIDALKEWGYAFEEGTGNISKITD